MSNKRAELRRQKKEQEKRQAFMIGQMPDAIPKDVLTQAVDVWTDIREAEIRQRVTEDLKQAAYDMESMASVSNLLISMYAIKMTWGFTKSQDRFLKNLEPAKAYIKRVGIKKAYNEIMDLVDTDIWFEDFDHIDDAQKTIDRLRGNDN